MSGSARACIVVEGGRRWALPVTAIGEIADLDAPLPLPRCAAAVLGLGNLRGQALAVVDLGALLAGAPPRAPGVALTVAVARLPGCAAGLAVERVEAVVEYDPAAAAPARPGDPPACGGRLDGEGAASALLVGEDALSAALAAVRPGSAT